MGIRLLLTDEEQHDVTSKPVRLNFHNWELRRLDDLNERSSKASQKMRGSGELTPFSQSLMLQATVDQHSRESTRLISQDEIEAVCRWYLGVPAHPGPWGMVLPDLVVPVLDDVLDAERALQVFASPAVEFRAS